MTTTTLVVIAAALQVQIALMVAAIRRNTRRVDTAHKALTDYVGDAVTTLRNEIGQVYLTEQDRKDLGLPPAGALAAIAAAKAAAEPQHTGVCVHEWTKVHFGPPRRLSNALAFGSPLDDRKLYIRKCGNCPHQQVSKTADMNGTWHDD